MRHFLRVALPPAPGLPHAVSDFSNRSSVRGSLAEGVHLERSSG